MGISDLIRKRADLHLGERAQPNYVYHGFSVRLPPQVHAVVHDQSLPEHVRGLHLARHLLTNFPGSPGYPHTGDQLGQDWHRDSYYASQDAREAAGEGRTPYVLKGTEPHPEHLLSDDPRKGHPMLVRAGAPVHFTGLFWNDPDDERNGGGELHFPEPITAKA